MNCIAIALLRISATLSFLACSYAHAGDPAGLWQSELDLSRYQVRHCGQGICVRIARIAEGPGVSDIHNPDPSLRNRRLIGIDIFSASKSTGDSSWAGALYNFRNGKTSIGRAQLENDNTLSITWCILDEILCAVHKMTRLE